MLEHFLPSAHICFHLLLVLVELHHAPLETKPTPQCQELPLFFINFLPLTCSHFFPLALIHFLLLSLSHMFTFMCFHFRYHLLNTTITDLPGLQLQWQVRERRRTIMQNFHFLPLSLSLSLIFALVQYHMAILASHACSCTGK